MKLKQLGLINWANLENRDYLFADVNLISGSSGAGKTTLLDAYQTVMTAAMHNIVHFNPGQDEATQHSRSKQTRSLASYILGCDDGKYARLNPTCGYIIAVFCAEQSESVKAFTALVGATARLDSAGNQRSAKLNDELYMILPGIELGIDDLLQHHESGNKSIVLLDDLSVHLKRCYRDIKVEPATGKEEYLRQLYGAFQGKKLAHKLEARNAARQLVKFMAYKPESNLDSFVRNAILEQKDMSEAIDQIQNMMKTIHTLEQEASLIEQGIGLLDKSNKLLSNLIHSQLNEQCAHYEACYREAMRFRRLRKQENSNLKNYNNEVNQHNETISGLSLQRRNVQDELRQYEAKKQGIQALQLQDTLNTNKQRAEQDIEQATRVLLEENNTRRIYRNKIETTYITINKNSHWFPQGEFNWLAAIDEIRTQDQWNDINLSDQLQSDIEPLKALKANADIVSELYREFSRQLDQNKNEIFSAYLQSGSELENKQRRQSKLQKEIDHMQAANRVTYRDDTERALRLIREMLPQADPQVVCDHIEVVDEKWQAAIEAFMGENRFLIVVKQEYELEALNLAKKSGLKSALVQGSRAIADANKKTPAQQSLFNVTEFTHDTVKAYFMCAYGDVLQVIDAEKLRSTRRGLMFDGRASSGYKLFVAKINDDDLKLGKQARQRALNAKIKQVKQLDEELQLSEMKKRSLECWHALIDTNLHFNPTEAINTIIENNNQIQHIEKQLQTLDLSEHEDILEKIDESSNTLQMLERQLSLENKALGSLAEKITSTEKKIHSYDKQTEAQDELSESSWDVVSKMAKYYPDYDLENLTEKIEAAMQTTSPVNSQTDAQALVNQQSRLFSQINENISQFNLMNLQNIKIKFDTFKKSISTEETFDLVSGFVATTDVQRQVDIAHNKLHNNILAAHQRNLQEISQSFNKTFVGHLCHTLYNYIQQGEDQLKGLNHKLKHHIFGEEHYEFAYKWVPEYLEYYRFLKQATHINLDGETGLFAEQNLSDDNQQVFDKIKTLLLSNDIEQARKELRRITDYRNFRAYDIFKVLPNHDEPEKPHKISLKSYGTGSGGQMETPSYVIRAAALSSALKLDVSRNNLKTLMIDESFGKMDEARSKAILKYLNKTLGYQILFVIPSKSSGPFHDVVDQVIEITKVEAPQVRGELHTMVHLAINILHKERIAKLWQQEKIQIRNHAQLSFLEELDEHNKPIDNSEHVSPSS